MRRGSSTLTSAREHPRHLIHLKQARSRNWEVSLAAASLVRRSVGMCGDDFRFQRSGQVLGTRKDTCGYPRTGLCGR